MDRKGAGMNRAFSAGGFGVARVPRALPQVTMNAAPLALNTCVRSHFWTELQRAAVAIQRGLEQIQPAPAAVLVYGQLRVVASHSILHDLKWG
jgi:hypothetical protein